MVALLKEKILFLRFETVLILTVFVFFPANAFGKYFPNNNLNDNFQLRDVYANAGEAGIALMQTTKECAGNAIESFSYYTYILGDSADTIFKKFSSFLYSYINFITRYSEGAKNFLADKSYSFNATANSDASQRNLQYILQIIVDTFSEH